ncbi:conserved hypothetical protein [Vibrio crassostreae]|nr:conserved hypothetical protein [Vibrio chagasii]CAK2844613.1 conserved hypothetical protein [Vibrio crassostreae]
MKKKLLIIITATSLIVGCNGGGEGTPTVDNQSTAIETQAQYQSALSDALSKAGSMRNVITQPPAPDETMDLATVEGVDSNDNGFRDSNERLAWQALDIIPDVTEADYQHLLGLMAKLEPSVPSVADSISEHEIYCDYTALKTEIKERLSLEIIYEAVLDTDLRRTAFYDSVKPMTTSLVAEVCQ